MTMITPSYLGETIEYSSLHACRSTLEDPTRGPGIGTLEGEAFVGTSCSEICVRLRLRGDEGSGKEQTRNREDEFQRDFLRTGFSPGWHSHPVYEIPVPDS